MTVVDIAIILIFLTCLMVGSNLGLLRQLSISAGVLLGTFLAILICDWLLPAFQDAQLRISLTAFITIGFNAIFITLGIEIGNWLAKKSEQKHSLEVLDKGLGILFGGVTALIMIWLTLPILSAAPSISLSKQFSSSQTSQLMEDWPAHPSAISRVVTLLEPFSLPRLFAETEPVPEKLSLEQAADMEETLNNASKSLVKVNGASCGNMSVGSGFFIAPDIIATNAHVVSGMEAPFIRNASGNHSAEVVWYDPNNDIALLQALNITGSPLAITEARSAKPRGTIAGILGYPAGGDLKGNEAIVLDSYGARGYDLYNKEKIERQVYSLQTTIVPGNSGGPVVDKKGEVIGLVFGHSEQHEGIGYALTADIIKQSFAQAQKQQFAAVGSGECYE